MIRNDPERIRTFLREREAVTAAASRRNNRAHRIKQPKKTKRNPRSKSSKQKRTRSNFSAENREEALRYAERLGQVCGKLMSISKYLKGTPKEQVDTLRKNKHAFDTYLTPEEKEIVHEDHKVIVEVLEDYTSDE
jgi:hypothetical protein